MTEQDNPLSMVRIEHGVKAIQRNNKQGSPEGQLLCIIDDIIQIEFKGATELHNSSP